MYYFGEKLYRYKYYDTPFSDPAELFYICEKTCGGPTLKQAEQQPLYVSEILQYTYKIPYAQPIYVNTSLFSYELIMLALFFRYKKRELRLSVLDVLKNASSIPFPQVVSYLKFLTLFSHGDLVSRSICLGNMFEIHSAFIYMCSVYKIRCAAKCDICYSLGLYVDKESVASVETICGKQDVAIYNSYDLLVFSEMYGIGFEVTSYTHNYSG